MEIIVASRNKNNLQATTKLLRSISVGIVTVDCLESFSNSLHQHTSLVIIHSDFLNEAISHGTEFLDCSPCLVIGDTTENTLETLLNFQSIDYLSADFTPAIFHHKIRFLLNQKGQIDSLASLSQKLFDTQQSMQDNLDLIDIIASRDGLTGLYNRRHFSKIYSQMFKEANKEEEDLSLLLIDIDYFSQINKNAGHTYGDFVLNEISARITTIFRKKDMTFRFGGEDFSVLLPNTNLAAALTLAEKFRDSCESKPFTDGHLSNEVTVSIGCTSLKSCRPRNQDEMVTMAEMAVYSAKSEGRNRIIDYQSTINIKTHNTQRNFVSLKNNLSRILNKTKTSTISSLQLLAQDIAGDENRKHIENVNSYVQLLCKNLNLPDSIISTFGNAISLHSSIRCLLHNEILSKEDTLDADERGIMQEFPYRLMELTELFDYFSNERSVLLSYGERYDGTGYPDGLKSNEIPLGSRIFNIVDSLAAMNADRPFRKKLSPDEIIAELKAGAGNQFDPFLVCKTLDIIQQNGILDIDQDLLDETKDDLNKLFPDTL